MKLYTIADLNQGVGVFNHVMHRAGVYPTHYAGMSAPVAIGVMAAALQSGLSQDEITDSIEAFFDPDTTDLLRQVRHMYNGDDCRLHLWCEGRTLQPFAFGEHLAFCRPAWRRIKPEHLRD